MSLGGIECLGDNIKGVLGTGGGIRTHDQKIKSLLLYQLSYAGSQDFCLEQRG